MGTFLARQPILDKSLRVVGYELLHRSFEGSSGYQAADSNAATAQVIADCLSSEDLRALVMGTAAFINFPEQTLLDGFATMLEPELVVVEVLETVTPSPNVVAALNRIKHAGYRIALDDYAAAPRYKPLVELADIVKIDVRATSVVAPRRYVKNARPRVKFLAEKVETYEEFHAARRLGYEYFQGYFFSRPSVIATKRAAAYGAHLIQLMEAVQPKELDYRTIERIISRDAALTHLLLRYVNSAMFGLRNPVSSVTQALMLIGEADVRRWASLTALCGLGAGKPRELLVLSLIRARFCEQIGHALALPLTSSMFLAGLLSLLDAMTDRPMEEALEGLPLDGKIKAAILGQRNEPECVMTDVLEIVKVYEAANWDRVTELTAVARIDTAQLAGIYRDALKWAEHAFASAS
ncbi:MAG: HDOD domain-containing protein [Bryobacterales bacterium]|nr:HDOD domain-containing protein [Bryobacterales bacterium]